MQEKATYEELDILVSAYQDGSTDAAERLVQHYDGYFRKFLNVMKFKFTISDRTQRGFLRYYIRNKEARDNTHTYRRSDYIRRVIYATVSNVKSKYEGLEPDEIKSELVILFLDMAMKHNFKAPFAIYVAQYFPRKFYKVTKGLVNEDEANEVYYDEDDIEVAHFDVYESEEPSFYFIQATSSTEYDENWVNGFGCGELFEQLTTFERRLLKWYYEWRTCGKQDMDDDLALEFRRKYKRTEEDIAYMLGCSRKTVNVKRNETKRIVEKLAKESNLILDNQSLSRA